MIENVDFQDDLGQLSGFITLAADKLQQNGKDAFCCDEGGYFRVNCNVASVSSGQVSHQQSC